MRVLFTICGRAGSKGIRNKNIKPFLGKPLPYYSISAIDLFLKREKEIEDFDIVVSSDSPELRTLLLENPLRRVQIIERSPELSGDTIGKVAVISDCLQQMEKRIGDKYDVIIDLDITSPLRRVSDLQSLFRQHQETGADVTTSVVPARRNPYFNQLMKTEHGYKKVIPSDFTARQQAPEIFDMNASMYAYSRDFLLSGKGVLDGYCECIEMKDTGVLDLDHENDLELMEVIAGYLFAKDSAYGEVASNI